MANRRPSRAEAHAAQSVATAALIPLRIFLGGTFVYAGIDKLIDPRFLAAAGPGSIADQLQGFARSSPLAFAINAVAIPHPVLIGLGMALLELAIGLGALTGWLFRASAALGAAVSLLFWLTASWSTTPYFYGPDLPYAAGWLTLALAGTGGAWTLSQWLEPDQPRRRPGFDRRSLATEPESPERRQFLQAAGIAGATALIAGPAFLWGRISALGGDDARSLTSALGSTSTPTATTGAASPSAGSATEAPTATPAGGTLLASGSQLSASGAVTAYDPALGDPVIVVKLPSGSVVAYDAVCTHAGCTVAYDQPSGIIYCPCHGAEFDPAHNARVLGGPTNQPLAPVPISVNAKTGDVMVKA